MFEDWELIEASFASQYGIRLNVAYDLSWNEFSTLLSGLMDTTPLGHIVSIRAENDKERLKGFNSDQHTIRNAWRSKVGHKLVHQMSDKDKKQAMQDVQKMFKGAFLKS